MKDHRLLLLCTTKGYIGGGVLKINLWLSQLKNSHLRNMKLNLALLSITFLSAGISPLRLECLLTRCVSPCCLCPGRITVLTLSLPLALAPPLRQ